MKDTSRTIQSITGALLLMSAVGLVIATGMGIIAAGTIKVGLAAFLIGWVGFELI